MKNQHRTKEQLMGKLTAMRQRVAELEEIEFERAQAELALQENHRYTEAIIETVREALVVLDAHLKVLSVNWSFCDTFQVTSDETIGEFIFDLGNGQWDIPALRKLLEDILPANTKFDNYEVDHIFPSIGYKVMLLNARRIYQEGAGTQKILLAIEDITERKQAEEERERLILQLRDALSKVRTLHGMLPICASCKRIRNDEGYWEQVEAYIRDHSEAEFTHGICPDCSKELYPEYYKKK